MIEVKYLEQVPETNPIVKRVGPLIIGIRLPEPFGQVSHVSA